jgi:hypothetical protein
MRRFNRRSWWKGKQAPTRMPTERALIGMLIAASAGWSLWRHARRMMLDGVSVDGAVAGGRS